jgi:hypothetical protein
MVPFSPWLLSILMIIPVQLSEAGTLGLNLQDRVLSVGPSVMSIKEEKRSSTGILRSMVVKNVGFPNHGPFIEPR